MKTYYSAQDIEALAAQGVRELVVDENTVLTDLARETAAQLGVKLVAPGRPVGRRQRLAATQSAAAPVSRAASPRAASTVRRPAAGRRRCRRSAESAGNSPVVDELVGAVKTDSPCSKATGEVEEGRR